MSGPSSLGGRTPAARWPHRRRRSTNCSVSARPAFWRSSNSSDRGQPASSAVVTARSGAPRGVTAAARRRRPSNMAMRCRASSSTSDGSRRPDRCVEAREARQHLGRVAGPRVVAADVGPAPVLHGATVAAARTRRSGRLVSRAAPTPGAAAPACPRDGPGSGRGSWAWSGSRSGRRRRRRSTSPATSAGAIPPAVESRSAAVTNCSSGPGSRPRSTQRSGRLRSEVPMAVATSDGTSRETPTGAPTASRSWARHSVRPTAANFDV